MPRVVPSQVVDFINTLWPSAAQQKDLNRAQQGQLSGLVDLCDQIPGELLTMDSAAYARFICAKAHIRQKVTTWVRQPDRGHELGVMPGQPEHIPVTVIRDALSKCHDSAPAPGTSDLNFITDTNLRESLRIDMSDVNRALFNGEWKAATVLAGSAAAALLLWALNQQPPAAIPMAVAAARASKLLTTNPKPTLEQWVLHEYIEVAAELGVIKPKTAVQVRLAKDFRNFIHPGVSQRLGEKCDRATALSAVAGMEHIVRDLLP
jgi:hypothetical protein